MIGLGAFDIERVAGAGGMAEVWAGAHRAQRVPVAVKVLTAIGARDPQFVTWFRSEVRAVAAMNHPGIIGVLDFGTIGKEAESQSDGRLVAGSPYLVMEWAARGSLADVPSPSSWSELRATLMALLQALAHAHARGVVHRDIKLRNVLVCEAADGTSVLKLADFGIARPNDTERDADPDLFRGTIAYAAPEQIRVRVHEQGPWTDLYALGCVAYKLASGRNPFSGRSEGDLIKAHLSRGAPRLDPRFNVPAGFEDWLTLMLEKRPLHRFRHAADAMLALRALGEPLAESFSTGMSFSDDEASSGSASTTVLGDSSAGDTVATPGGLPAFETDVESIEPRASKRRARNVPPTMPDDWRERTGEARAPFWLSGAGLGLFGLRAVPTVDRESERDRIWSALRRVHEDHSTRVVILRGPEGCGKGHLAEWLCERAMEVGAANFWKAMHDRSGGPTTGLAGMLAHALRSGGLPRNVVLEHLTELLSSYDESDPYEALALAEIVSPAPTSEIDSARVLRFGSRRERHEVLKRHLERVATERPLIVWLDDVHYGADALSFVQTLLERPGRRSRGMLVICTASDEVLPDRPLESEMLDEMASRAEADRIDVGPLAPEHWALLVRQLLGLDGELAMRVEQRAAGNPSYAVQVVGDWIQRGLLEAGEHGFRLRGDVSMSLPRDLRAIWAARAEEMLSGRGDDEAMALELAAVLGTDVDGVEWMEICGRAGIATPWTLLDALLDRRLARAAQEGPRVGWSFAHARMRDAFEQRAREGQRLDRHHRACADMLRDRVVRGRDERLGRHLLAAGDYEAALEPLIAAAREQVSTGDMRIALTLAAERQTALERLGAPANDPRWAEGWTFCSNLEITRGHLDEGVRWASKAEHAARVFQWTGVLVRVLVDRGRVELIRGHFSAAHEFCEEALGIARDAKDLRGMARALHWQGIIAIDRGETERALEWLGESLSLAERLGDERAATDSTYELVGVWRRLGHRDEALRALASARQRYDKAGLRNGVANAMVMAGEIARDASRFEEAERAYRESIALYDMIGSANGLIARVNLGLALIGRGHYADARRMLEETLATLEKSTFFALAKSTRVELLPCLAHDGDWNAWDTSLELASGFLTDPENLHPDPAWAMQRGAEIARDAGQTARAVAAFQMASQHWQMLKMPSHAAECDRAASEIANASAP